MARKDYHTIILLLWWVGLANLGFAQSSVLQQTYGAGGSDKGNAIAQTSDGGFIIAGQTTSYGAGGDDILLTKTDADGALEWSKAYGGSGNDYAFAVQQTSDGGYIATGHTTSWGAGGGDVYTIKTDANGTLEWSKAYGGSDEDWAMSVRETAGGDFIMAGYGRSFGTGDLNIYLIKINASGTLQFYKRIGTNGYDLGYDVIEDANGDLILAGNRGGGKRIAVLVKISSDGGSILWNKEYGGNNHDYAYSLQQTSDGGFIVSGYTESVGSNGEIFVFKTNSSGTLEWMKGLGGGQKEEGFSVVEDANGDFLIGAYTASFGAGGEDALAIKLDNSGNVLWAKTYGGGSNDRANQLILASGGLVLGGSTASFGAGSDDFYLIKADNSGPSGCNEATVSLSESTPNKMGTPSLTIASNLASTTSTATSSTAVSPSTSQLCFTPLSSSQIIWFRGEAKNAQETQLNWQVADELYQTFTLERSEDGKRFSAISQISGSGCCYSYTDTNLPKSDIIYYRLRLSGGELSSIISIKKVQANAFEAEVYPNVISRTEKLTINYNLPQNITSAKLMVYDMLGMPIHTKALNTNRGRYREQLELITLSSGYYVVVFQLNDTYIKHKLLVK